MSADYSCLTAEERRVLERVIASKRAEGERLVVTEITRESADLYDVIFKANVFKGRSRSLWCTMSGWLPLAFLGQTHWTDARIALRTDYPEMAVSGDWSGVRDTTSSTLIRIFRDEVKLPLPNEARKQKGAAR